MRKSSLYKALDESGSFSLEQWQKLGVEIMKNRPPEWAEVVEDKIIHNKNYSNPDMKLKQFWMLELVRYFLGQEPVPVRIKCRKGAILIERITTNKGVKNE